MYGPYMEAYLQELYERPAVFAAFMKGTKELPLEVQQLIWSFNPAPEPPSID